MDKEGGRVLVVDDDAAVRLTLRSFLESEGLSVETAANGAEALQLLEHATLPGIILLDLLMPILSGWQFLDLKAQDARLKPIPVVLMTAFEHEGVFLDQVVAMLRKPFDFDRLIAEVRKAIDGPMPLTSVKPPPAMAKTGEK
jgi:CheY-like chemotaxis protein